MRSRWRPLGGLASLKVDIKEEIIKAILIALIIERVEFIALDSVLRNWQNQFDHPLQFQLVALNFAVLVAAFLD